MTTVSALVILTWKLSEGFHPNKSGENNPFIIHPTVTLKLDEVVMSPQHQLIFTHSGVHSEYFTTKIRLYRTSAQNFP
jgi:hypothetical protein